MNSVYQYAVESGYTGTETEFAKKLTSELLIVGVTDNNGTLSADKSYSDILDAIHAGIPVLVDYDGMGLPLVRTEGSLVFGSFGCVNNGTDTQVITLLIEITEANEVNDISAQIDIPTEVTPLIGTTTEFTPSQVQDAVLAGRPVVVQYTDSAGVSLEFTNFNISFGLITSAVIMDTDGVWGVYVIYGDPSSQGWAIESTQIATTPQVKNMISRKVDKVDGKGLSTNDYTTDEKTKLSGINAGAQVNVLESVKVNGAVLTATDKTVDISVPTKTSDLTNDSGYITSIPSEYITESELNAKGYLTNYTETDPTVPDWAKAATKPTYTAAEVGALPADTVIPVVPDSLKNPYAITFTGGATGSYDGSSELSIAIPEAKTYKAGTGIFISDDGTISVTVAKIYSGTTTPDNSTGENGDIYIQTEG